MKKILLYLLLLIPVLSFGQALKQSSKTPASGANAGNQWFQYNSIGTPPDGYMFFPYGTNLSPNRAGGWLPGMGGINWADSSFRAVDPFGHLVSIGKGGGNSAIYFTAQQFAGLATQASPITLKTNVYSSNLWHLGIDPITKALEVDTNSIANNPNAVIAGLSMQILSDSVTLQVAGGVWRIGNNIYSRIPFTNFTTSTPDLTLYRYESVYATKGNTVGIAVGVLNAIPVPPNIPDSTVLVGTVLITPHGPTVIYPAASTIYRNDDTLTSSRVVWGRHGKTLHFVSSPGAAQALGTSLALSPTSFDYFTQIVPGGSNAEMFGDATGYQIMHTSSVADGTKATSLNMVGYTLSGKGLEVQIDDITAVFSMRDSLNKAAIYANPFAFTPLYVVKHNIDSVKGTIPNIYNHDGLQTDALRVDTLGSNILNFQGTSTGLTIGGTSVDALNAFRITGGSHTFAFTNDNSTALQLQQNSNTSVVKFWNSGNVCINCAVGQSDVGYSLYIPNSSGGGVGDYALIGGETFHDDGSLSTTGLISRITTKSSNFLVPTGSEVYLANATSAPFTFTLPDATLILSGTRFTFKKIDAVANSVTISTVSSQTIDAATTYVLSNQWDYVSIISNGSNWRIVATNLSGGLSPVTAVSIASANGISGSSSGGATPVLTIALGAITPTSTNGVSAATMAFNDATSSIQTQLNGKSPIAGSSSIVTVGTLGAGSIPYSLLTGTPSALPPSGTAGGELAGTYPNPTVLNSAVIGKVLTGYSSGAGTVASTDNILQAFQKINGNEVVDAANIATNTSNISSNTTAIAGKSPTAGSSSLTTIGTIGSSPYTTAGLIHNTVTTGAFTSSLIAQADVTNGFVDLSSTQSSIAGAKGFTNPMTITSTSAQLTLANGSGNTTFNTSSAGNFTLTPSNGTLTLSGLIILGGANGNINVPGTSTITSTTNASYLAAGETTVWNRIALGGGSLSTQTTANNNYKGVVIASAPVTMPTTGTTPWLVNFDGLKLGAVTNASAIPVTNTATGRFYGQSTAGTNNYTLFSYDDQGPATTNFWAKYGNSRVSGFQADSIASFQHIKGNTSAPTIAAGTGAGTSPTVTVSPGTDIAGKLNITTGTSPAGSNAIVATITFNTAYAVAPHVVLTPGNRAAQALTGATAVLVPEVGQTNGVTTTTFVIESGVTNLTASTAYIWTYHVIQ